MRIIVAFATVLAACAIFGADAGRTEGVRSSHNKHSKTSTTTTAGTLPQAPAGRKPGAKPTAGNPTSGVRLNAGINANAYCFDCLMRTNNKDLFANPVDCHSYFQCVYVNETDAIGIMRMCQPGTYFDETRLTCRTEGAVPCQPSPCSNPTVAALGCYQLPGQSCRQYFTCQASEPSCCPENTRFDPNTCGCTPDPTCTDYCQSLSNITVAPTSNETACSDPFGNTLLPVEGHPELFQLGDFTLACAPGTNFNLTECACTIEVNITRAGGAPLPVAGPRQCQLWLPFDTDLQDKSISHFATFAYGNAELDVTTAASGVGSLRVNDGRLEIPGMKTMEFNNPDGVSWCFSYRCANGACSDGGILSNNRDMSATFFTMIGAISGTNLVARVMTDEGSVSLQGTASAGTWNSACVVYRENATVELYNNGALTGLADLTGPLTVTHCPYVVGNDQFYGNFIGNIDNVLVCNSPLSMSEIQAHASGDIGMLESAGLIPETEIEEATTTTTTEAPSTRLAGRTTRGVRPVAGGNQANQPQANRPTTTSQPTTKQPMVNQGNQEDIEESEE